jgi:hypothetical protein
MNIRHQGFINPATLSPDRHLYLTLCGCFADIYRGTCPPRISLVQNVNCYLTGPTNFQQSVSLLFRFPCTLAFYLDRPFNPAFGVIERATYASMCATFHDKPVSGALARDIYDVFAEHRIAVSS